MTRIIRFLITIWTLFSACLAYPDVHKYMNSDQLQSIFHVDHIHNVPHYELVKLIHQDEHHTQNHLHSVNRRSINTNYDIDSKESHHVKKDLSKTPYYSELKFQSQTYAGNSLSDRSYSEKIKNLDLSQIKEHNVSFSAFGEVLNLTLKPTEGLFKNGPSSLRMWMVRSEPNATQGVNFDEIIPQKENNENVGEVFQDEENMAAILMRRHLETGDLMMEGSIGHEMVIKPLPHELAPVAGETHHIIYKRETTNSDHLSDFAYMEADQVDPNDENMNAFSKIKRGNPSQSESESQSESAPSSSRRKRRAAPYMIYPEILVIVDYDGYRLHGGDNVQVKRYFVSFWNGVDLRYRLLKGPRIRISIAGIIISRGRDATPYLERNRVGRDAIDSAAALTDMGKYLFRERRLPVYDIAVAITKLDMCRRNYAYGECKRGTAGFAYVGGACVVNKRLEKVNSVAIIEDTGGFSGIIVAAHEVGHLLGAVHDGSPPPSYLGGPGAERCRWEDGYIMSDLRHTERGFRWSPCTIQSFHHFLNGDTASCLHNAPHEDAALGRSLPGTLLSLDAQCRRDRGTYACFKDDRVCAQLFCFDAQTGYCVAYRPAAEGSSCGNGSHCLDGRCVPSHSNNIPDYNHQYRSNFNSSTTTTRAPTIATVTRTSASASPLRSRSPIPETVIVVDDDIINNNNNYNYKSSNNDELNGDDVAIDNIENHDNSYRSGEEDESSESESSTTTTQRSYILGGRSTTRSSFFESYFKKLASTTRSPYNFDNFGQFFKRSKNKNHTQLNPPPPYTTNFLGDNSNNLPVNVYVNISSSSTQ